MLTSIGFKNFKSWESAELPCGTVTGVFGTNSSGKTSLLQFILMLKQTKDATDRATALELNGEYVQLGTIHDILHGHDEDKPLEFNVSFSLFNDLSLSDPSDKRKAIFARGKEISVSANIESFSQSPSTTSLSYQIGGADFSLRMRDTDKQQFELKASGEAVNASGFRFIRTKGRAWQLPGPIKSYAFPDQARTYFQNAGFLADLEAAYEAALDKIFYLGPLRDFPRRDYLWSRSRPSDVGQKGERAIDAILAATEAGETRNLRYKGKHKPFQEVIAHWLKEMGLIDSFRVEEIAPGSNRWQARVRTRRGATEVLLTDVGFGVSQVLPVVTLLQYVPEGATVMLEQPEIHLHPLAQAGLADVIIQAATHRRVQIILESHSEHLLLRLQRRIAEEKISSEIVRLYFCDAPAGVSNITSLELDLYGRVLNWPKQFMGDAFNETAEAELARIRRLREKT